MEQRKENRGSKNEKRINPREPLRLSVIAVKTIELKMENRGSRNEKRKHSALTLATHVLCGEIYLNRRTREHGTEEGKSRVENRETNKSLRTFAP